MYDWERKITWEEENNGRGGMTVLNAIALNTCMLNHIIRSREKQVNNFSNTVYRNQYFFKGVQSGGFFVLFRIFGFFFKCA